jgi:hypothetical protein
VTIRHGSVTTTAPITVTLDGETDPIAASPINLGQALGVGDRVACEFRDRSLVVLGSPVNGRRDLFLRNFGTLVNGGGVRTATATGVSWSQRLIGLGAGRHLDMAPDGYFEMYVPADGTVIPVIGHLTQTSATVSGGIIPLNNWQALYYAPPLGASRASDPSRFYIASYNTPFEVPPTWVPLVWRNGDLASYTWADGRETAPWTYPTLTSPWINFGSGYASARYKRENGIVQVEGLVRNGAVNGTIFNLPSGYRPDGTLIFLGQASGGVADLRISNAGNIWVAGYFAGGTNGDVSLSNISFSADL